MFFLHMNTSRPLFSHLRLRRAVNYAIDRPALVAQGHRFSEVGPFNTGVATDDYLPPSVDGAEDTPRRYARFADLARDFDNVNRYLDQVLAPPPPPEPVPVPRQESEQLRLL